MTLPQMLERSTSLSLDRCIGVPRILREPAETSRLHVPYHKTRNVSGSRKCHGLNRDCRRPKYIASSAGSLICRLPIDIVNDKERLLQSPRIGVLRNEDF